MSWNPNDPEDRRSGRPGHVPRRHLPVTRASYPGDPDWEAGLYEPIPRRRRTSPFGFIVIALIALMFAWEGVFNPTFPDARFHLQVDDTVAYAYGGTDADSFEDVRRQLDENPQIETIVLRNIPGTTHLGENTRIARMIRARGIDTHLEKTSYIASGGVDLFLAGEERTMECGARIGVHSWRGQDGETPRSLGYDPIEDRMITFHEGLGIGPDFYPFTRDSAPHESLYFLDREEIERFDLLTDDGCERVGLLDWFR